jgi:NAD(P)-dependent dehydrogenase (short-subunit alcohol dehydrogenase family)
MSVAPFTTPFSATSTAADVVQGVDLVGKRAIVTGGASGIGIETARALASAGASVTLAARRVEAAQSVAAVAKPASAASPRTRSTTATPSASGTFRSTSSTRSVAVLLVGGAALVDYRRALHAAFDRDALLVRGVGELGVVGVVLVGVGTAKRSSARSNVSSLPR